MLNNQDIYILVLREHESTILPHREAKSWLLPVTFGLSQYQTYQQYVILMTLQLRVISSKWLVILLVVSIFIESICDVIQFSFCNFFTRIHLPFFAFQLCNLMTCVWLLPKILTRENQNHNNGYSFLPSDKLGNLISPPGSILTKK